MTRKQKKTRALLVAMLLLVSALAAWVAWANKAVELNRYTISSDRLPKALDGLHIAQVSDLHNTEIGKDNETLLGILKEADPDLIAITGDLIDSRNTNLEVALAFAQEAGKIAPCYYIPGNHEARVPEYEELKAGLRERGITVLENEKIHLEREGESLSLVGVKDPGFSTDYLFGDAETVMRECLQELVEEKEEFTILLSHRPELFETYVDAQVDLVLSGHAHGGQFRLPWIGGLIAPNQGLFPKYDSGLYREGNTAMLVSRGVGNSIIPLRFNNRPEVILVELQASPE